MAVGILLIFFIWFMLGYISSKIAHAHKRNENCWFLAGILLGPIAIIVLVLAIIFGGEGNAGSTQCEHCFGKIDIRATICKHCRKETKNDSKAA